MTITAIFLVSLSCASVLVAIKDFEVRRKKRNFALGALSRLDERSLALIAAIKFRGLQFIQSVRYIVLVEAKNFIIVLVKRYCNRIYSEYTKARERTIMGQKQIESRGSVSFFLKKITEEKSGIVKGKIEETL